MCNRYYPFVSLAILILLLSSCNKESEVFHVADGSFASGGLSASSSNIVLSPDQDNDTAVTFRWTAASFGDKTISAYTLQLDVPSDTASWANAKSYAVGNNIQHYSFLTKVLNDVLTTMALPGGTASTIVVRIKADLPQYNGLASSVASVYSNTLAMQATPYSLSLYIPGAYQGWNPGGAPLLNPIPGRPGLYEAYEYMPGSGLQYFKYTNAPDWNHTNYGDNGSTLANGVVTGSFSTDGNAGGLYASDGGYIEVTANFNTNTWTTTQTTWGIIGDATPGGWDNDTQMSYNEADGVWTVTANLKAAGSFKFRANNAWVIDFGIDGNGNLQYADNPFFGYTAGLNNLTVPSDGNYTITLDLHVSGKYNYSLVKN